MERFRRQHLNTVGREGGPQGLVSTRRKQIALVVQRRHSPQAEYGLRRLDTLGNHHSGRQWDAKDEIADRAQITSARSRADRHHLIVLRNQKGRLRGAGGGRAENNRHALLVNQAVEGQPPHP